MTHLLWGWPGSTCVPRGSLGYAYRVSGRHQLKKKKIEETCLVMEFLSFQQDPGSIAHNYVQLSYGNYKQDPCAGKDLSGVPVIKSV